LVAVYVYYCVTLDVRSRVTGYRSFAVPTFVPFTVVTLFVTRCTLPVTVVVYVYVTFYVTLLRCCLLLVTFGYPVCRSFTDVTLLALPFTVVVRSFTFVRSDSLTGRCVTRLRLFYAFTLILFAFWLFAGVG